MGDEVVGESVLSASLQVSFRRMASRQFVDFFRRNKFDKVLHDLKKVLVSVSKVLNDAEIKQFSDGRVRSWLDELKDPIYCAEDLIYRIYTEAEEESGSSSSRRFKQVRNFKVREIVELIHGIVELIKFIGGIMSRKYSLRLIEGVEIDTFQRSSSSETSNLAYICGRDADRKAIIDLLLLPDKDWQKISVIPIVGEAGIGKTTLAQLVYMDIHNNPNNPFDIKAWITVGDKFDVFTIAKGIYHQAVTDSPNCDIGNPYKLQLELNKSFEGKRFLFVLDDVRTLEFDKWGALKRMFSFASHGGKIIVTTNIIDVGFKIATVPIYKLRLLSDEDCWQLFSKHVFNNVDPSAYRDLEEIGRQIVKKCRGVPLAVMLLAGLLCTNLNTVKWENVLNNEIWHSYGPTDFPALSLSHRYLPNHLKQCFAYCSIFPRGYRFQKKKLILLWMAQDLLLPQNNKMLEEVGEEYFNDLESRSFFQKSIFCDFTMHGLIHDFAEQESRNFCLRLNDNYLAFQSRTFHPRKTRHLLWMGNEMGNEILNITNSVYGFEHNMLRTLLQMNGWFGLNRKFSMHPARLQHFKCLRVLSLCRVDNIERLLHPIGKLKLLRYLDLSWTEIKEIPNTICSLYNLQTLLLHYCGNLSRLPDSIGKLKHLRYLDLSNTQVEGIPDALCNLHDLHTLLLGSCRKLTRLPRYMESLINLHHLDITATSLREIPPQITNLGHLEILSDFYVGTSSGTSIKVLDEVQDMHGNLRIRSLKEVVNVDDVVKVNLKDKKPIIDEKCTTDLSLVQDMHGNLRIGRHEEVVNVDDLAKVNLKDEKGITDLSLEWEGDTVDSQKAREVLDKLQPHVDLVQISVIHYGGLIFSDWISDCSFSRLVYMWLSKCKNCFYLPPLGQLPSLKSLSIDGFDMVKSIGDEFYGSSASIVNKPFKSLEKLNLAFMPRWKEWSLVEGEVLSKLKELHLKDCPSLMLNGASFPDSLPSLVRIYISKCQEQVVASLLNGQLPLLSSLYIGYCPELKTFPERRLPTNIQTIEICGCENLESFSEEGWPSNLKSLSIGSCGKLFAPCMQWNLQTLTSLASLDLSCIDDVVDSFPEEGKLPKTLTSLTLCRLHNLKSLNGKAFQQLTSLKELSISYCEQLQCMPKEGLPPTLTSLHLSCLDNLKSIDGKAFLRLASLVKLSISYCPQLPCMPEGGLPGSLSQLIIEWCRFLNPRCQRERGEDWPKIAHIPCIYLYPD